MINDKHLDIKQLSGWKAVKWFPSKKNEDNFPPQDFLTPSGLG